MPTDAHGLRIADFTYELPDARIARYPLPDRSSAKLLQYRRGDISSHTFRNLPDLLPPHTLLIGNETRVIHARLHFTLDSGKPLEIFCLEPLQPVDYAQSLGSTEPVTWKCLIGGNRRWKSGPVSLSLSLDGSPVHLSAQRGARDENTFAVTFHWQAARPVSFAEVLELAGTIPLPPYLGRTAEAEDQQRYQTVFARREGSVAAPTAGLHFTPEVLQELTQRGIAFAPVTLHVGAGTFKPVSSDTLGEHVMHREYFTVSRSFIERVLSQLQSGRPIVCIGTTSLRCLESLFYEGASLLLDGQRVVQEDQWVATRDRFLAVDPAPACSALLEYLDQSGQDVVEGYTQLLLTPASRVRMADGLITNFHQPNSTLLLLVATLIGPDWRRMYDYALQHDYRFLSYGDSSLLWRRRGSTE
ncbi:S-adenosylmethionine:tRNA ribosyltransferase-isomerase [Neolewinella maritima]|uniref:S-adenosylmethionine:tRNA ribosyltransferase-isomerase n=1 Tax=Neolewinella maritima TaxID=1383882 RepID=A0ABM9AXS1_9BACT|nr:S-adenosylmethionine:tRNA ribosyltransferase-isomerase [Neolewinella maritima]CAH0999026.1 S-adenosylmethionine:tRNA ribosyltransferase-isomerase [Neolewinella maritima]